MKQLMSDGTKKNQKKNEYNFHGLCSREIAVIDTKKRLLSVAGVFILLYKLRKKRQKLKIRDLFVYLNQRERMWC